MSLNSSSSSVYHLAPAPGPGRQPKTKKAPQVMHQLMLESVEEPLRPKKRQPKRQLTARKDEDKPARTTRSGKKY